MAIFTLFVGGCHLEHKDKSITITFVGDLLLDRGVKERIDHLGVDALFDSSIDSLFQGSDMVIANLECPTTTIKEPINKKYIFQADPDFLADLQKHGITHLNMANNHSMDQGRKGLIDTYGNIIRHGLIPTGYGANYSEACQPQLLSSFPRKVYLISSLQVSSENWTFLKDRPCVCEATLDELSESIRVVRNEHPLSVILVQLHWGAEHTLRPLISQKQQAYKMINAGADAIIGHHSHTIQTIEHYKGKPIYYSIGNFIFDQSKPINSKGLAVTVKIDNQGISVYHDECIIEKCRPMILN